MRYTFSNVLRRLILSLLLVASFQSGLVAQTTELVQFSGIVMSSDTLEAIPYTHVVNTRNATGAVSNTQGFFSFVAAAGDTILFTSIGYKPSEFVIPNELTSTKYSVIQLMTSDTIFLDETLIYPWPTPEDFREAFLALDLPDNYLDRARKNLEHEKLREMRDALPIDGNEAADFYFRSEARKYYYAGQDPPMRIFDVFAWKEFIDAWKRGDFKRNK